MSGAKRAQARSSLSFSQRGHSIEEFRCANSTKKLARTTLGTGLARTSWPRRPVEPRYVVARGKFPGKSEQLQSTLQHPLPTRVAAEVAHRVMRVVDPPGRLPANVSFGRVTGSQNSPSPCALTTSLTSNTSVHGPHRVHAAGLTLATVVGEPHCCSAVTVNTSNTVQLPTFEQLYHGVHTYASAITGHCGVGPLAHHPKTQIRT